MKPSLQSVLLAAVSLVFVGGGCLGPISVSDSSPSGKFRRCQSLSGSETVSEYPRRCFTMGGDIKIDEPTGNYHEKTDMIYLTGTWPVEPIKSPMIVTGEARGTWFFEASFPVVVEDENGSRIGGGIAQATEDWMTEEFVPFTVTLDFTDQPAFTRGYMIFNKDNPSGLPEHDDFMKIPVTFGK